MSEAVDMKLREAKFFFHKLASESEKVVTSEPEAYFHYLCAFLGAAEALRNLLKPLGFDWSSRPKEELAILNFMHAQRVLVAHTKGSPDIEVKFEYIPHLGDLRHDRSHAAYGFHYFATPLPLLAERGGIGARPYHFKGNAESVIEYSTRYVTLLKKLVGEFT
jgi:hypothetical protein